MSRTTLLVTGASGQLGRRAVEFLLAQRDAGTDLAIIATTREPERLADLRAKGVDVRRADFDDPSTLAAAFAGAERALLVSTDSLDVPGRRIKQHQNAIAALEAAGVKHVVYTSLPNAPTTKVSLAPDHASTEAALAASRLDFTILRNNLYQDLNLFSLPPAIASGQLVDAKGGGAIAWVTREDCARAAAFALLGASGRETLDVTGPEALTADEVAAIASSIAGKTITHVSVPEAALVDGLAQHMPRPIAEVYASFDVAASKGDFATVTDTVERFSKTKATSLRDFLAAHRAKLA